MCGVVQHFAANDGLSWHGFCARISTMTHNPWRLDPARFPQRVDLDLPDEVMDALELLSARTGRSLRDLIPDLLAQELERRYPTLG
jgi:Ribbon-helix-helix protein, copG family